MSPIISQTEVEKNIDLAFDFIRYVLAHPDKLDEMPNSAVLQFLEMDGSPQVLSVAEPNVYYVRVKRQFDLP
jgi:hypothetical protein